MPSINIDAVIAKLQEKIEEYGLELMQRYPNDLLVHDRRTLDLAAMPDIKIAWMVGDSHTHIVVLGIHQKENQNVTYLTNMCSNDRFHVLTFPAHKVWVDPEVYIKEVTRDEFAALSRTAVPYERKGDVDDFYLLNGKMTVGQIRIRGAWVDGSLKATAHIRPLPAITAKDKVALEMWANQSMVEAAQSLFVQSTVVWEPDAERGLMP